MNPDTYSYLALVAACLAFAVVATLINMKVATNLAKLLTYAMVWVALGGALYGMARLVLELP